MGSYRAAVWIEKQKTAGRCECERNGAPAM